MNVVDIVGVAVFVVFFGMTFCVIPLVERDILVLPIWKRKAQPKDEHPMQSEWDVIVEQQEERKHPLLRRPPNPDLDIVFPLGRSGVQPYLPPAPKVDRRLIGLDQR